MNERDLVVDDATMKFGLLMESAQGHQKLAQMQLEQLREHTAELDGVVRDEIRRTLLEELRMCTSETNAAVRMLQQLRHGAARRHVVLSLIPGVVCTLIPLGIAHWTLPSASQIEALRTKRDQLAGAVARLEQQGGRIDLRHCGDAQRLCVRIDVKAPSYGEKADYLVVQGF